MLGSSLCVKKKLEYPMGFSHITLFLTMTSTDILSMSMVVYDMVWWVLVGWGR